MNELVHHVSFLNDELHISHQIITEGDVFRHYSSNPFSKRDRFVLDAPNNPRRGLSDHPRRSSDLLWVPTRRGDFDLFFFFSRFHSKPDHLSINYARRMQLGVGVFIMISGQFINFMGRCLNIMGHKGLGQGFINVMGQPINISGHSINNLGRTVLVIVCFA